jgi:DNA repair exonuclease SbcCD ATPase subunit
MVTIKNHLAAAFAITAALLLTGCDISAQRRAEQAEAKAEMLQQKLDAAEKKAALSEDYRRAAAVAQACDFPLVWRLCPQQDLALGKSAIENNYTADQAVFWLAKIGILAALGAALGAAVATGRALWLRFVAPFRGEIEEARQMIATAKEQAERWRIAERQAQRSAQQAAEEAAATRDELEALAAQKIDLEADLAAARAELKRARDDLDALRGGFL